MAQGEAFVLLANGIASDIVARPINVITIKKKN